MNCIYRSIWNDASGTYVAVSELASNAGKTGSSRTGTTPARFALTRLSLCMMLSFGAIAHAAPVGGVVSAGQASINGAPTATTITQSSQNVAINWQAFNIGAGETVKFVQPNSNAVALNRVLGADPSSILGKLDANGKVFLVNPNGIMFGSGASVNVGALLASTLQIGDADFMAGRYQFAGNGEGAVSNLGTIATQGVGGFVALLGANVSNDGVIVAKLGSVALAAGQAVTLDVAGDGLLNLTIGQGALNALASNGGLIRADGGQVLLSAQAAGQLAQSVVNNTGVIQAQSLQNHNGSIRLLGDMQSGTVNLTGTLDASASAAGQTGGDVTMTARHVGLFGQARIDASGEAGGGTVSIGGGLRGANPAVRNAQAVYMAEGTRIDADATGAGNGGQVVLWSDSVTKAYGAISARGGARAGDGGLVETSGHVLEVGGAGVDANASHGKAGTWLLDPFDVTVTGASINGGFVLAGTTDTWTPNASGSTVANTAINASLDAGNNVIIQTDGNVGGDAGTITVAAPITRSVAGAPVTLTLAPHLAAGGTVTIGAAISGSAGAPLTVKLTGSDTVAVSNPVTTFGGDFSSTGSTFANAGGAITTAGGKVDILHTTTVAIGAPITTNGGNFKSTGSTFTNAGGAIDTSSGAATGGTLTIDQSATVALGATLTTNGADVLVRVGSTFADTTTINAGTHVVTIQPQGDATTIGVGTNTNTLIITNAEINAITAGTLIIGRATGTADINIGTNEAVDFGTKNVVIQQASGGITAQTNSVTGSGSMTFTAGTGTFTNNVAINTTGAISITADDFVSIANVGAATAGAVVLANSTPAQTVNVASIAAGLNITEAEVNFLRGSGANTGSLTIGSLTGAGLMSVGDVAPLVVVGSGDLRFKNGAGITFIGPVSTVSRIAAESALGDITLQSSLTTTDSSASAIVINAGSAAAAGTAAGGNILVAGGTLSPAAGGRSTLFTGGIGASTGVTSLVGAGTGRFRYNSDEVAANYTTALGAGSYAVYRQQPALAATVDSATMVYGTATPGLGASLSGLQNGDTEAQATGGSVSASIAGPTSATGHFTVGNHDVSASGGDLLGYAFSASGAQLTVTPASLIVTAGNVAKTYGETATLGAFTTAGLVSGETVGSVTETSTGAPAGAAVVGSPYAIVASSATGGNFAPSNYAVTYVNGALTIAPAALSITAANVAKTYGEAVTPSGFTTAGLLLGDTVGAVTETSAGTAASAAVGGSPYAIVPSAATGGSFVPSNYTIAYINGVLTVAPVSLQITAADATKVYGQTPTLSAFTAAGLVGGDTVGSVTETSPGTLAGAAVVGSPYTITPSAATGGTFLASNYTIAYVDGALTVTPASLVVTASNVTKLYGDAPTLSAFTMAGLVGADTVGSVTETSPGQPATAGVAGSPYAITPSSATGGTFVPSNYTIAYVNGTLTVVPRALVVTAADATKVYGQTPTLSAFSAAGLIGGDTIGSVTETSPGTPATAGVAGSPYPITPSSATGGTFVPSNYTIAYVNGTLTVVPRALVVTADNATKVYGETPTPAGFTTSALVNGETVGSVTETSPGTVASAPLDGSPYPIVPSDATGGTFTPTNYTIDYVNGLLDVTLPTAIGVPGMTLVVVPVPPVSPTTTGGPSVIPTGTPAGLPPGLLTVAPPPVVPLATPPLAWAPVVPMDTPPLAWVPPASTPPGTPFVPPVTPAEPVTPPVVSPPPGRAVPPAAPYVAPVHPRKQDRN